MSWSWSHTTEAYEYAQKKLRKMSQKKMAVIWAEWKVHQKAQADKLAEAKKEAEENGWPEPTLGFDSQDFDQVYYEEQLKEAKALIKKMGKDTLADDIWERACELATCDNGGWNAWMCPYGCDPHAVPFSPEKR